MQLGIQYIHHQQSDPMVQSSSDPWISIYIRLHPLEHFYGRIIQQILSHPLQLLDLLGMYMLGLRIRIFMRLHIGDRYNGDIKRGIMLRHLQPWI